MSEQFANHVADASNRKSLDAIVIAPQYQPYHRSVGYVRPLDYIAKVLNDTYDGRGIGIPILLYNNPCLTGANILVEDVEALANDTRVIGIKDSSSDMTYFSRLVKLRGPNFSVFQGSERVLKESLEIGIDGCVPATGNTLPKFMVNLVVNRDIESFDILKDISQKYRIAGDPVKVIKESMYKERLILSPELINYL